MYMFLDFDGVLTTSGTYKRWRKAGGDLIRNRHFKLELLFDPHCVEYAQQLCDMVGAEVVLSTSWRTEHDLDDLKALLRQVGFTAPVIDKTPEVYPKKMSQHIIRGDEIAKWIEDYETQFRIDIPKEEIIILEDAEDVSPYKDRQVRTSFSGTRAGFQKKHLHVGLRLAGWKVYRDEDKNWVYVPPGS